MSELGFEDFPKWAQEWTNRLETNLTRLDKQIGDIESLTRENLPSFPYIFQKAKTMLERCAHRFWMLNFTPAFGLVHAYDKLQLQDYWRVARRRPFEIDYKQAHDNLKEEVTEFTERLRKCADFDGMLDFRLATVDSSDFHETFLKSTLEKMGDALLNPKDLAKQLNIDDANEIMEQLQERHEAELDAIQVACARWNRHWRARGPLEETTRGVTLMQKIPLQIFISDVKDSQKQACLVFFIGDFNVRVEKRVSGFYTEQIPLVTLFEQIFESNVGHFRKSSGDTVS